MFSCQSFINILVVYCRDALILTSYIDYLAANLDKILERDEINPAKVGKIRIISYLF